MSSHLKRLLLGSSHPGYHGLMLVIALYVAWRVSFPCH